MIYTYILNKIVFVSTANCFTRNAAGGHFVIFKIKRLYYDAVWIIKRWIYTYIS